MDKIIESLKSSPLFNLSLSSKELFHSNFLFWVFEKNKIKVASYFTSKTGVKLGKLKVLYRENRNMDLTLVFENSTIVLENKVKSIPDEKQLRRYQKKIESHDFLYLLSVFKPKQFTGFNFIGYDEIVELLSEISEEKINAEDKYEFELLNDYCQFINNFLKLTKEWEKIEYFDFHTKFKVDNDVNNYSKLKKIRIHDLYHKIKYNQLCSLLLSSVKILLPKEDTSKLMPFEYFSNGTGAASLWYFLEYEDKENSVNEIRLELQIQDDMVRLMIISKKLYEIQAKLNKKDAIDKIYNSFNSKELDLITERNTYPLKGGFNKFGNDLIYKYKKIRGENIPELVENLSIFFSGVIKICEEEKENLIKLLRTD